MRVLLHVVSLQGGAVASAHVFVVAIFHWHYFAMVFVRETNRVVATPVGLSRSASSCNNSILLPIKDLI